MTKIKGLRNIIPNLVIVVLFILIAYAYLFPLLEGKVLQQSDITHFKGMSKELVDYRNKTGEEAIWTNSMFGGMPGYLISVIYNGNLVLHVKNMFGRMFPFASKIILYLLGFYILLITLGVKRWLSFIGAVGFGLSSYFLIILAAGHNTKADALGYLPIVIAGVLMVYKNKHKPIPGALLFTLGLTLEILAGHLQISYYGLIMLIIYGIVELFFAIKEKALALFIKSSLFLLAGTFIAVGMNFSRLYTTWEYSKTSIRGSSELTTNGDNKTSGLDKDYVVMWSYGIGETFTLLVPNFKGGASQINPGINSESYKELRRKGVKNPKQALGSIIMYHGTQPGTSGPVYVGAIILFLFFLGLFVVKGRYKWWLLIATIISIILSWGGNIMWLTSFLLDYLPMYNKFRVPSMILVIAQTAIPLLGFIALNEILTGKTTKKEFLNGLKWATIITGGLALLFAAAPSITGSFSSSYDLRLKLPDWLINAAVADRKAALRSDAFRSFIFIALAAGLLYLWQIKKVKTSMFIGVLGFLILIDLWAVDKRYLNNDNFVSKRESKNPFVEMPVDKAILQDSDLSYRVLPLQSPFQDARTSYYHKNVGGYHAAKLRRYQEIIEHNLSPEMQQLVRGLRAGLQPDSVFSNLPVINMMNTRYLIYDLNKPPLKNTKAFGNAWFVNSYKIVADADEEIATLKNIDPANEVIIDKRFAEFVNGKKFSKDINGKIKLVEYQPNYLKYKTEVDTEQLAVFSEIYSSHGWNAFVDGKEVPHFRGDYILRAMIIPAGKHTVEFNFHPKSYFVGNKISLASSILLLLVIAGYIFSEFKKRGTKETV
jgi:hypothetical protein